MRYFVGGCSSGTRRRSWSNTRVDASWLNQIEIYFSILPRKALHGALFNKLNEIAQRIQESQGWYNTNSHSFKWTWTCPHLNDYLNRLAA